MITPPAAFDGPEPRAGSAAAGHEPPLPPAASPEKGSGGRFALPPTAFVWIAILVLLSLLGQALRPSARAVGGVAAEPITASAFEKTVASEMSTRLAFGASALADRMGVSGGKQGVAETHKAFDDALKSQRAQLAGRAPSADAARRVLILARAAKRKPDPKLLDETLPRALRAAGKSPNQIRAETALWRAVYGSAPAVRLPAARADEYDGRLRGLRLGFLENRALADLYAAAGDVKQATVFARRFDDAALRFYLSAAGLMLLAFGGFLLGLIFLGVFLWTARDKHWTRVARVATAPQALGWGELIDAFLFYLAFYKSAGLLLGLALSAARVADLSTRAQIGFGASVQFFAGLVAVGYLVLKARRRGVTLADIGLTTRGRLLGNLAYGVAGYLATLPLLIAAALISQAIFKHFPNTTPNPMLPLMAEEASVPGRLLIFLMVAGGAPFFEEVFFRGALFGGLRARFGWVVSAGVSALLFAVVHPPNSWLPIAALGVGLATMREMRQSLIPCFVAHALQNTSAFIVLSLLTSGGR